MTKFFLTASAAAVFALAAPGTASAADLNAQIEICQTEIQNTATLAELGEASVQFRSNGGGAKRKKLSFMVSTDDDWGVARCTIVNEEVKEIRWPSEFRQQIEVALAERDATVAETGTQANDALN